MFFPCKCDGTSARFNGLGVELWGGSQTNPKPHQKETVVRELFWALG